MLNIISRQLSNPGSGAIGKVARNLIKGLEKIGYPFVVNKALDSCPYLYIQDDYRALINLGRVSKKVKTVIGPNLFVMPRDIPKSIRIPHDVVYIHPSPWAAEAWRFMGFDNCTLDFWPVGIDVEAFRTDDQRAKDSKVMVYFKNRRPQSYDGLGKIQAMLRSKSIDFDTFSYGSYAQSEFMERLAQTKYVIWYGCQESQGLALQEALAMNCPIIVVDVDTLGQECDVGYQFTEVEKRIPATSAPYFDSRCGMILKDFTQLPDAIADMEARWKTFEPRKFVEENLSLEGCARNLLSKFGIRETNTYRIDTSTSVDSLPEFRPPVWWVVTALEMRLRR